MKNIVKDWIFLADRDLSAAEVLLKDEYPLTNIVAFLCQQTIEKYLKAFLIENDISLVKTHNLLKLNDLVNEVKDLSIDEEKLDDVNEVYTESRYPGEIGLLPTGMPTYDEANDFWEFAKEVKSIILKELISSKSI